MLVYFRHSSPALPHSYMNYLSGAVKMCMQANKRARMQKKTNHLFDSSSSRWQDYTAQFLVKITIIHLCVAEESVSRTETHYADLTFCAFCSSAV